MAAFIAAFAMALQALWPLIAHAKPRSVVLVPVCTIDGVTHYLELPGGRAPAEESAAGHADHCSMCVFEADPISPAHTRPLFLSVDASSSIVEHPVAPAVRPPTFAPGRPRAPPVIPLV
jgi:hypothetical protein